MVKVPDVAKDAGGSSFQDLSLSLEYTTGDNLLDEFYIPTLKRATSYDRAAGYFSSKSLQLAAQGIAGLIMKGGTMRLLASPNLSKNDLQALKKSETVAEELDILSESLDEYLFGPNFKEYTETDRFKCLAWMVKEGFLEIRLAYMKDSKESNPFSIYHEKFGVMTDGDQKEIAFSGSLNETGLGWTDNYESFEVYRSWQPGEKVRIRNKQRKFERLWNNEDEHVTVRPLPDAIQEGINEVSPDTIDGLPAIDAFFSEEGSGGTIEEDQRELWPHQQDAIDWWQKQKYAGIFAMATGSGKTLTALRALRLQADVRLSLIVVPSKVLIDQWKDEVYEVFGSETDILECSGRTDWRNSILSLVDPFRVGDLQSIHDLPRIVLIATLHTASSEPFLKAMKHIPKNRHQIIVDEVHRAGAPTFQSVFDIDAGRRIGLSATPDRKWDEEGTNVIHSYFGSHDPFTYTTKQAIEDGYLTRYEYYPLICELSPEEYEDYIDFTDQINQLNAQIHSSTKVSQSTQNRYEKLLRDRAKIKKTAKMKPKRFGKFLDSDHPTPAIVFCEDSEQLEQIEEKLAERSLAYGVYTSKREEEQADSFYRFEKGLIDYLLAIKCLDEGVDVPDCSTAVIIASSRNEREFIQRRGRVLRKSEKYDRAEIYDVIVLPGLAAPQDDEQAKRLITQELSRAKILMSAAENQDKIEQQLANELDSYGSSFRYLAYT